MEVQVLSAASKKPKVVDLWFFCVFNVIEPLFMTVYDDAKFSGTKNIAKIVRKY
ncbi:hypothetical protein BPUM_0456 [Bacillus pumilus SAFR-032]|uniref:Uncharacterized protein n=1 Tax=Bacillus pumilus (strain SAFR-032) TaxID=315750 RepID=A8FA84_BACP2|nr:hypothetical protein BPUM_0456 [Bacillus pumilus SAFR-032]